ncbi:unnamed protein product, partial [Discosporangium mesarthrocarpum]
EKLSSLRWLLGPGADLRKIIRRKPEVLLSNVETTVADKFRQLQELFPSADAVKMVERDATLLFYDFEKTLKIKVESWRDRVTNTTELDSLIESYPVILSYSLDMSVSRLDYLKQNATVQLDAADLRRVVRTSRAEWEVEHGAEYRKFLERKVEGPSLLRLWPGLYFSDDTEEGGGGESKSKAKGAEKSKDKKGQGERECEDSSDVRPGGGRRGTRKSRNGERISNLEKKYGKTVKESQLRFRSVIGGNRQGAPTEMDMALYDLRTFDKQVRKLATGQRLKRFREVLPGLDTERLFADYPKIVLMDLRKFEEGVSGLRNLLMGGDVAKAVSLAPELLLNDVVLCLRPRFTRLVAALQGSISADEVREMVIRCPHLLLSDVRNTVVPGLRCMLRCCEDHQGLGRRLYRDPALLLVGVGPLARLQFTLEEHQSDTSKAAAAAVGLGGGRDVNSTAALNATHTTAETGAIGDSGGMIELKGMVFGHGDGGGMMLVEGKGRLLPLVLFTQILKCSTKDFVERNPTYVTYLMQRQGLGLTANARVDEGQIMLWERAVGARLCAKYRPGVTSYAAAKMAEGPDGQKRVLSELDLLVGDVLHVNKRLRVLFRDRMLNRPEAVYLSQEVSKLAEDLEWGSRQ